MALWKETTESEQEPRQDTAKPVQETPSVAPAPAAAKEIRSQDRRESFFGPGVTIEGKIEGDADVRIGGKITGDIQITGNLNIDRGAKVAASVKAANISIEGEVEGNITASAQVQLLPSAQVIGDVKATTLTVAAGSRMRGHVEFGWGKPESEKITNLRNHEKGKTGSAG